MSGPIPSERLEVSITQVALNPPHKHNAICAPMRQQLDASLRRWPDDDNQRCAILQNLQNQGQGAGTPALLAPPMPDGKGR